jgi:hypothetical protein
MAGDKTKGVLFFFAVLVAVVALCEEKDYDIQFKKMKVHYLLNSAITYAKSP